VERPMRCLFRELVLHLLFDLLTHPPDVSFASFASLLLDCWHFRAQLAAQSVSSFVRRGGKWDKRIVASLKWGSASVLTLPRSEPKAEPSPPERKNPTGRE